MFKKIQSKIFFILLNIFFLLMPNSGFTQIEITLPKTITVYVNDSLIMLDESWMDSLISEATAPNLYYRIAGANPGIKIPNTVLRIPEIFSLKEVIMQVIFFYALFANEHDREKEFVYIYPYFASTKNIPDIFCTYESLGIYYFKVHQWNTMPIPKEPSPEQKFIYNQIMKKSFDQVQNMDSIPDEIFEEVAEENKISLEKLKSIYQQVVLWKVKN